MVEPSGQSITCASCGQPLRWREAMIGRKMKCACGQIFIMPPTPGSTDAATASPLPAAPPLPKPPEPASSPFDHDAFELDLPATEAAKPSPAIGGTCPSCRAPMKAGAVLCVQCGFHTLTGSKLNTGTVSGAADEARRRLPKDKALLDEEPDHRFTEIYLPVAMIIVGVIVTIIRAYSGMGEMTAFQEEEEQPFKSPFFVPSDSPMFDDMEEEMWDEEEEEEPETLKDAAKLKDTAKSDVEPVKDAAVEKPEVETPDDETIETPEVEAKPKTKRLSPSQSSRPPPISKPSSSKGFNASPLLVAGFSLVFQLLVMVPVVFGCVLFVAKYVDVTFGSLSAVLLKLTAVVLGPMAIADWIDDILITATLGMGAMLGWTIRLVLVGSSLIKLFDLDFFEAIVLMIVVAMVRFLLAMFLIYAMVRLFIT